MFGTRVPEVPPAGPLSCVTRCVEDFEAWVVARRGALARTAYLLILGGVGLMVLSGVVVWVRRRARRLTAEQADD